MWRTTRGYKLGTFDNLPKNPFWPFLFEERLRDSRPTEVRDYVEHTTNHTDPYEGKNNQV